LSLSVSLEYDRSVFFILLLIIYEEYCITFHIISLYKQNRVQTRVKCIRFQRSCQILPKLKALPSSVTMILWTLLLPDATSLTLTPLSGVKRCGDHRLRPVDPFVPDKNNVWKWLHKTKYLKSVKNGQVTLLRNLRY